MGIAKVLFWDSTMHPPKLDAAERYKYKELLKHYPGALIIIDTLRSGHSGDENDSRHMEKVMAFARELRDLGATVIVLHHTPKSSDTKYKGSSAIFDMADHILALYPVRRGTEEEADEDDDVDKIYRFGTKDKTRYRPFKMFLTFDTETELFTAAADPDNELLEQLHKIIIKITGTGISPNQKMIIENAKSEGMPEKKIRGLLGRGEGKFWTMEKGAKHTKIYQSISNSAKLPPYIGRRIAELDLEPLKAVAELTSNTPQQTIVNAEFGKSFEGSKNIAELNLFEGVI